MPTGIKTNWPYQAAPPQRYSQNYERYVSRGGLVDPEEDVKGFITAEPGNRGDMARFYFFSLLLDQLVKEGITGDLAELGVYKGGTATLLAGIARRLGTTAYLMDTFQGFDAADFKGIDVNQKAQFSDTSLDSVRALVGEKNVRYIPGHFPGSAAQIPADARFAVVHIDCDLYKPMLSALEYFYPRMVPGGFMVMHDYSSLHWNGAEQAVDEFFASRPESPIALTDGAGSAVVRKAKKPDKFDNWLMRRKAQVLANGWVNAAQNALADVLGDGWSGPEDWGVWGVGATHELNIYLPAAPTASLLLEADVHAVLLAARTEQLVDVRMAGTLLARWHFDHPNNRAIRQAVIPAAMARGVIETHNLPCLRIELAPDDTRAPSELKPEVLDDRPLGVALHGLRIGPIR